MVSVMDSEPFNPGLHQGFANYWLCNPKQVLVTQFPHKMRLIIILPHVIFLWGFNELIYVKHLE